MADLRKIIDYNKNLLVKSEKEVDGVKPRLELANAYELITVLAEYGGVKCTKKDMKHIYVMTEVAKDNYRRTISAGKGDHLLALINDYRANVGKVAITSEQADTHGHLAGAYAYQLYEPGADPNINELVGILCGTARIKSESETPNIPGAKKESFVRDLVTIEMVKCYRNSILPNDQNPLSVFITKLRDVAFLDGGAIGSTSYPVTPEFKAYAQKVTGVFFFIMQQRRNNPSFNYSNDAEVAEIFKLREAFKKGIKLVDVSDNFRDLVIQLMHMVEFIRENNKPLTVTVKSEGQTKEKVKPVQSKKNKTE